MKSPGRVLVRERDEWIGRDDAGGGLGMGLPLQKCLNAGLCNTARPAVPKSDNTLGHAVAIVNV